MKTDRYAEFFTPFHRLYHEFLIHQGLSVICKPYGTGRLQFFHIRKFFPFEILRYSPAGVHMN